MANTRIILNRQSDLKLTGAEILEPIGIVEGDIAGLVAHFEAVEASISTEISDRGVAVSAEESARIAGDSSLESKLNSDIAAEESSRISGDVSLEAKVSTEKARIDAILEASDADKDSFAEIVTLINSVDTENDQAFASYVLSNDAALSTEESSRISGDASLELRLSIEESTHAVEYSTEVAARETAISAEESSRIAGDDSLELRLSIEESTHAVEYSTEVATREAAVSAEKSSRILADQNEQEARVAGDLSLETVINNLNVSNATDLSAEISSRESGDASLDAALSAEISRAIEAEGSIATVLSSEVSSIIANTDLTSIDSFAEVVSELDVEESVRLASDTSLEAEIDALPLTDDVTIEVDGDNNIRLKDTVAAGVEGSRTFEGLNNAGVQPNTLPGYGDLSFITKGILDAFDTSVTGDVSAEASSRAAADASLELRLSVEESTHAVEYSTEVAAREAAISAEESSRVVADGSLESKINSDISSEESSRVAGDASIQSQIDAIMSGSTVDLDNFSEVVAFVEAIDLENDNSLLAAVSSIETKHDAEVSAETSSRVSADLAEQNARIAGDAAVTAAYEAAVSVEASTRVAADASLETKLNSDISAEESSRVAGDASLELRLSIEESTHAVEYSTEVAAREAAISAEESTRLSIDEAIKAGVNNALTQIKGMVMNAAREARFKGLSLETGDGVTTDFGVTVHGAPVVYLNGLLQHAGSSYDYTTTSGVDGKGNPVITVSFNNAPEDGALIGFYGQESYVANDNWYGDLTPLV